MKAIINGRLITPNKAGDFEVRTDTLLFTEKIEGITKDVPPENTEIINAAGAYVAPGFINIHVHGAGGADTMDDAEDALGIMAQTQLNMGVTSFLPTTMTYDFPRIYRAFERISQARENTTSARILGANMEGPFISKKYKGAQAEENIINADFSLIEKYTDVIKILTFAPEELADFSFVKKCRENGIIPSIGHTAADFETAMAAVEAGATHFTHLYNAMTPFHHRRPGVVGAALDSDAYVEIIADNVHSTPTAQRILYKTKAKDKIILITDSLRACGLGDGESELGGQKVFVNGTLATLADGTIAGSVLKMNDAVRIFAENTGADIAKAVEFCTKNPAVELGLYDKIGSIEWGKLADLVIFDDKLQIKKVIVGGEVKVSV